MPGGRPKGSKTKVGLTLEQRLRILGKIATDKNAKATDVINACKEITLLLNDRIKESEEGLSATVISFENTNKTPEIKVETQKESVESKIETTSTTTTLMTQIINLEQHSNNSSMTFGFEIRENSDEDNTEF